MTVGVICGAESTVVHTALARPVVGALICVALGLGGLSMIGEPDQFGGCGTVGGDLMQVTEVVDRNNACAVPKEAPVQKVD